MEFTIEELEPIAEQLAGLCAKKVRAGKDRHILELEEGIRSGLKELGCLVLGKTLKQAEGVREKEIASECGGQLTYQRQGGAKIESIFGWVSYERNYYAGCECGQGKAPLDEELGLKPGEITPGLGRLLALAGSGLAFGESTDWIREFLLLELSENSDRKGTQGFGQFQVECEAQQKLQSQDEAYLQERLRTETERPERLYGSLDGAHVRIEEPDEDEKRREMKTGCWYQVEPVPASQHTRRHRKKAEIGQQALRAKDQQ